MPRLVALSLAAAAAGGVGALCVATRRLRRVLHAVRPEAERAAEHERVQGWLQRQGPPVPPQEQPEPEPEPEQQEGGETALAVGKRIIVGGMMGSGKTTLAAELATLLQLPHIPVDELYHLEGATEAGEWRGSAMDVELRRRMNAALERSGGWIVEANPWQVPTWVWDDQSAEVLWLDYDNAVNYLQLARRAARTWWTGALATHDDAQALSASLRSQLANCVELMTIVYKWGEENRNGWRTEARFQPPRAVRFTTPAELRLWLAVVRKAAAAAAAAAAQLQT